MQHFRALIFDNITYIDAEYVHQHNNQSFLVYKELSCNHFDDVYSTFEQISVESCLNECLKIENDCKFVVHANSIKSNAINDSTCLLFDSVQQCDFQVDTLNLNVETYFPINGLLNYDYPSDWIDKYFDTCEDYDVWCSNGNIFADYNEFVGHRDTSRYNLTALDVCTQCGGGYHSYQNNVIEMNATMSVINNFVSMADSFENNINLLCYQNYSQMFHIIDNMSSAVGVGIESGTLLNDLVNIKNVTVSNDKLFDFFDAYMICRDYKNKSMKYYLNNNKIEYYNLVSNISCDVFSYVKWVTEGDDSLSAGMINLRICDIHKGAVIDSVNFAMLLMTNINENNNTKTYYLNSLYFNVDSLLVLNKFLNVTMVDFEQCEIEFAFNLNTDDIDSNITSTDNYAYLEYSTIIGIFPCESIIVNGDLDRPTLESGSFINAAERSTYNWLIVTTCVFFGVCKCIYCALSAGRIIANYDGSGSVSACSVFCLCSPCVFLTILAAIKDAPLKTSRLAKCVMQLFIFVSNVAVFYVFVSCTISNELGSTYLLHGGIVILCACVSFVFACWRYTCDYLEVERNSDCDDEMHYFIQSVFLLTITTAIFNFIQGLVLVSIDDTDLNQQLAMGLSIINAGIAALCETILFLLSVQGYCEDGLHCCSSYGKWCGIMFEMITISFLCIALVVASNYQDTLTLGIAIAIETLLLLISCCGICEAGLEGDTISKMEKEFI